MFHCIHSENEFCEQCWKHTNIDQMNVLIAQMQRQLDLLERLAGYDQPPLFAIFPSQGSSAIAINTDYQLPQFEMAALVQDLVITTDATAVSLGVWMYHPTITLPNNRVQIAQYAGTGTFPPITGKITVPAKGYIGVRFAALTGGTYVSIMGSYSRSEQTGIEWFRSQRIGRVG